MKIGSILIPGKIVIAPLAGYTNQAYRSIMKEAGADLVYTEMISAKGLLYDNDKTWDMTQIDDNEHPISMQLFGSDTDEMVQAAHYLDTKTNCDIIDINMGCPVKKVLKSNSGAYLLKDINHLETLVTAVVSAVQKPVTVKIRAGWDRTSINHIAVSQAIERAGASAIAIHGRLKSDFYHGKVNLDFIKEVKASVTIPVIGNGDIKSLEDAIHMLEYTGVDAVMIGRGTMGNPWLVKEIKAHFDETSYTPPTKQDKINALIDHFHRLMILKGEKIAVLEMRSLASWYVKGIAYGKEFKQHLIHVQTKEAFLAIIEKYLNNS